MIDGDLLRREDRVGLLRLAGIWMVFGIAMALCEVVPPIRRFFERMEREDEGKWA